MRLALTLCVLLSASMVFGEDEPAAKQAAQKKGPSAAALVWARETVAERLKAGERAPEFAGDRDWLNVRRPLTLGEDLKGKVVVLDFWCYCCINCIHVLPDLEYLEARYADKPFAVVGVHSAKFTNEKDVANIRNAVLRNGIAHPVVNDADFKIWRSFGARSWPTFAVIAPDGTHIGNLSGEGHREDLDALVQATLEHFEQMAPETLNHKALPMRPEVDTKPPGMLAYPGSVLADAGTERLYIADSGHNRIVELALDGTFLRAFGSGERGLQDGPAAKARFARPQGLAIHAGVLWVCDTENHALRTVDLATGAVSTAAGTGSKGNHWRQVHPKRGATVQGPWRGRTTALNSPWDIVFAKGTGYIAMAGSHSLWTIDPETKQVSHFAGDLSERRLDAEDPRKAAFAQPSGLVFDGTHLYVADSESSAIVRVGLDGATTTLAGATSDPKDLFHFGDEDGVGSGRRFQHPLDVALHGGRLWVADAYNHKLKTLDPKTRAVHSVRGSGAAGHADGTGAARFSEPSGLSVLGDMLYIADTNNHVIRTLSLDERGVVGTLVLRGVPIPTVHARGGVSTAWPVLPGTVYPPAVQARVSAGTELTVDLVLDLPPGWKLNPDAPSALRVEVAGQRAKQIDLAVTKPQTTLTVPAFGKMGPQTLTVRLLYYVCQDGGACRMRSVEFDVQVAALSGAKGSGRVELRDAFLP